MMMKNGETLCIHGHRRPLECTSCHPRFCNLCGKPNPHFGWCLACREADRVEQAKRATALQASFDDAIRTYNSGYEQPLTYEERKELIDVASSVSFDGEGPLDVNGCLELIDLVESLR